MNWKACRAAALVAVAATMPAFAATPAQEAQAQISQGDYKGALERLDSYLAKSPQDAEARFTRGLALVKLGRNDEAIKAFSDLTRDYPQLPEPYNNLAVLYAQKGDYEKARDALEAALATRPAYATAHENLGDIYAALAGAAYNRALQLDRGNDKVRQKLALIAQLNASPGSFVAANPPQAPAPAPAPAKPSAPAPVAAAAPSTPAPASPPPAAAAAPPAAAPPPAQPAAPAADLSSPLGVLNAWAQAWSSQDVDQYLSFYAPDFQPEGGASRAQWETQRRARLSSPAHITVQLVSPQLTKTDAKHVSISFTQAYSSDSFSDQSNKVIQMSNAGNGWKIVREVIH